jgi:hypothetical protein
MQPDQWRWCISQAMAQNITVSEYIRGLVDIQKLHAEKSAALPQWD